MRKQKPRNAFVASDTNFIDLGVVNMSPVSISEDNELKSDVKVEVLEPKNWNARNKVIVRNS